MLPVASVALKARVALNRFHSCLYKEMRRGVDDEGTRHRGFISY
jgi:hypothetical protein